MTKFQPPTMTPSGMTYLDSVGKRGFAAAPPGELEPGAADDEPDGGECVARQTSVAMFRGAGSVSLAFDDLAGGKHYKILSKS